MPWIAALDADIEVASAERGTRVVGWEDFFVGVKRTSLAPDEMITAVLVPERMPEVQEFSSVGFGLSARS